MPKLIKVVSKMEDGEQVSMPRVRFWITIPLEDDVTGPPILGVYREEGHSAHSLSQDLPYSNPEVVKWASTYYRNPG